MTSTTADGSWLSALIDAVIGLMDVIGPAGAGLAIALENLFPPLPSEAILPMAGIAAHDGAFGLWEAVAWTTLGSLVGALALYGLGAWLGLDRLRRVADRLPLIAVSDVDRTVAWFQRHGGKAVFFGRFIPIFRSLISIPAGVARMPVWRFSALTTAGSLIWNTVFILCGWFLGSGWHIVEQYVDVVQNIVIVVVAAVVVVIVVLRIRSRRAGRSDASGEARQRQQDSDTESPGVPTTRGR
ncbi:DedA family protein [Microbacterium esteraromaticum]|uniref:DedA family protein n=1 Tax=Microbacterium esteraromaticum TaxID=57043 RepID=UPI001D5A498F|nr:DedA family protein [Microbacterium esteraromaticum]MBM7464416.1 membrane protein DedA with SNARE-associated domain [Microbacterium esteraromaticum]